MSFNKIIVQGNLGRDPELRYTPQGTAVCNFTVATSDKRRDKSGEMQEITTWFTITLWGKQAENASKYLQKGSPIYIMGSLTVEEWVDRENNPRFTLKVNATDMQFIGGGKQQAADGPEEEAEDESAEEEAPAPPKGKTKAAAAGKAKATKAAAAPDDDIPF